MKPCFYRIDFMQVINQDFVLPVALVEREMIGIVSAVLREFHGQYETPLSRRRWQMTLRRHMWKA